MMKVPVCDKDSGEKIGEINIPDDVLEAARLVSKWMEDCGDDCCELYGLTLAD